MTFKVLVFAFVSLLVTQAAHARPTPSDDALRCSQSALTLLGKLVRVGRFVYPGDAITSNGQNNVEVAAATCKAWASDKSKAIAVLAYDAGIEYEKRLLVALVDTSKLEIVSSYQGVIEEDASLTVGPDSFRIDTARYDLAPGVRAFGFDTATSFNQGCVDGGFGPARTLFVQDGKTLRPILEGFYISSWRFIKGGPSCAQGNREIVTEDVSFAIGITKSTTNGYANLRITSTSSYSNGERLKRKPLLYEPRYNGMNYPTDAFNRDIEKRRN
ncbi:MAG TPA: hypothetical protein VLC92_07340 [Rhodocyclaceae bacterium]|nr:hypothetical protein [Rhodocyclaceae bacterium]